MNPTVAIRERFLETSGELVVEEHPCPQARPTLVAVRRYRPAVRKILKAHGASNARLFGSVAHGDARSSRAVLLNAVDVIAEFADNVEDSVFVLRPQSHPHQNARPDDSDLFTEWAATPAEAVQ